MKYICTACKNKWTARKNSKSVAGYGCPPCPKCGAPSVNADDYGDFICRSCGKSFRKHGNGGLSFGMVPKCPYCHSSQVDFKE